MSKFELYSEVQLAKKLPNTGFIEGDVATVVEIMHSPNNETAYCLEFFDNHGGTLDVVIAPESAIQLPLAHGVVHYREHS